MRILVVEDTKDMNRLIVKALTKAGYSVDGCFDGEEALDYLAGAEYDGIVLDVMMPKMDGRGISRPAREAVRPRVSSTRSPTVRVSVRLPACLRVMARMRASSSSKAKGLTR